MEPSTIHRRSLPDQVARALLDHLRREGFRPGDKIPTTRTLCEMFSVGYPTLREAIQQLETLGVVRVRHGAGIFVESLAEKLFVPNPMEPRLSRKALLDLIQARSAIEPAAASLAAVHADAHDLADMHRTLDESEKRLSDEVTLGLTRANMEFHRLIAKASKNEVFGQIMDVLTEYFTKEQEAILAIYNAREKDHSEHRQILAAIEARDPEEARRRMAEHLDGVADVLRENPDPQVLGRPD